MQVLRNVLALLAGLALAACDRVPSLPALGTDIQGISVSGLSSGAYMAGQFHVAHSKLIAGAGIVAGGPYGCAESVFGLVTPLWPAALAQNVARALNGCTGTTMAALGVPNVERLVRRARERAADGTIDDLSGLRGDRVYLFAGGEDRVVAPQLVRKARDFYGLLGVAREDIALVERDDAGHGFVTEEFGNACGASAKPFINDCDYDQAGAILKHIYGALNPPAVTTQGEIVLFNQDEFTRGVASMDDAGALFVPRSCRDEPGCRVHVVFHGCQQGRAQSGEAFIKGSGYNRWAAANRVVVLYPQATASAANPRGCWDWWGYTGPRFLTRDAAQIKAVRAMLERLAQAPG